MRPAVLSSTTTGTTAWLPLDITENPSSLAIGVTISATASYGVEYTYDDPFVTSPAPVAFGFLTGIPSGTTTNKEHVSTTPVRAVRLNIASNTGTVKLTALTGLGG
jgi:hypothetical protein